MKRIIVGLGLAVLFFLGAVKPTQLFSALQQTTGGELVVQDRQICYEGKTILSFDELPQNPSVVGEGSVAYERIQGSKYGPKFSSASLSPDEKLLVFIVDFGGNKSQWWGTKDLISKKVREGGFRFEGGLKAPVISPQGDKVIFEYSGGIIGSSVIGFYLDTMTPLKVNQWVGEMSGMSTEFFDPHWISNDKIEGKTQTVGFPYPFSFPKEWKLSLEDKNFPPRTSWVYDLTAGKEQVQYRGIKTMKTKTDFERFIRRGRF